MSRGVCSLKESWGEFSPYWRNTLLLQLKMLKWLPDIINQLLQAACYPFITSSHPIMIPVSCGSDHGRCCHLNQQTGLYWFLNHFFCFCTSLRCLFSHLKPTIFPVLNTHSVSKSSQPNWAWSDFGSFYTWCQIFDVVCFESVMCLLR